MTYQYTTNDVILVNSNDEVIGSMEKMAAHQMGQLHRAFSVFLFNDAGEMLIQKRAKSKYHSANLWSNACCSHPTPNESVMDAAKRRLQEELRLEAPVEFAFSFEYKTKFENDLIENELDHVLVGFTNKTGTINPDEVSELSFISVGKLVEDIQLNPENYTFWFKLIMNNYWDKIAIILKDRKLKIA